MSALKHRLAFERPIQELETRLAKLEAAPEQTVEGRDEIRRLRRESADLTKKIYSELEPWQVVQVARHPDRPMLTDYIDLVFDEFVELHGDKCFGDDRAMRTGFAKLGDFKVMLVGHQKGKTLKERTTCNYGCAHPEGYRKAISKMQLAAKYGLPLVCMIDTGGAYPGIGAEERGVAHVIANSMFEMSRLGTPVVCVVIGEGGSGGAIGIGLGDKVAVLEFAYYSVISPEGCSGILWKSGAFAEQAAKALKLTSRDLHRLGVIDDVIAEPLGGAHRDHHQMANRLKMYLVSSLRELVNQPLEQLLDKRYDKFRKIGAVLEASADHTPEPTSSAADDLIVVDANAV
jgi:acetyl-CoA carboxylase carboxyl transferase subunit alpha